MSAGSKTIETKPSRIEIVEPWCAGKYDPPMQEWLQLPVGDGCPLDDHHGWGTMNPRGYFLVRRCNECGAQFRAAVTPHMISQVVGALSGEPQRFILGDIEEGADQ